MPSVDFAGARFANVPAGYVDAETFNTAIAKGATDNQATEYAAQELLAKDRSIQQANGRHANLQRATPYYPIIPHQPLSLPPIVLQDWSGASNHETASQLRDFNSIGGRYNNQQSSNYPDPNLAAYHHSQQQDIDEITQQQYHNHEQSNNYIEETIGSWSTQPHSDSLYPNLVNSGERQGQSVESNRINTFGSTVQTEPQPLPTDWIYGNEQIYNGGHVTWLAEDVQNPAQVQAPPPINLHSTQTNRPTSNNDTTAQAENQQLPDTYAGRRNAAARQKFPFECGVCQKRFLYIDSAQKHHRLHHGEPTNIIQRYDAPKRPRPARPRNQKNAQAQLRRSHTPPVVNSPTIVNSTPAVQSQTPDNGNSFETGLFKLYTNEDHHPLVATASPTNMDLPTIHHPILTYFADPQPTLSGEVVPQVQAHHQSQPPAAPTIHNSSSSAISLGTSLINSPQLLQSSPASSLNEQHPKTSINQTQIQPHLPLTPSTAPDTAQQALLGFRRTTGTVQPLQQQSGDITMQMQVDDGNEWFGYLEAQRAPMASIDPNLTMWGGLSRRSE